MQEGSVVVAVAERNTRLDFTWHGGDMMVLPEKVAAGKDVESMLCYRGMRRCLFCNTKLKRMRIGLSYYKR